MQATTSNSRKPASRSGIAVAAQRRNSAGPMRDRRNRRQRDRERRLIEAARRGEA